MSIKYSSIEEQFLSRVIKTDTCWNWIGSTNLDGYGRMRIKKDFKCYKLYQAHRISYQLYKGDFDPKLKVCHSCDNPGCVNPEHLWTGTQAENIRDMYKKGKGFNKNIRHFGKRYIKQIRNLYNQGRTIQQLSKKYNRHTSSIRALIRRRVYKD